MPTQVFIRSPDEIVRCPSSSSTASQRHSILTPSRQSSIRRRPPTSLSSKDISASSRLSGYLLIFTAYIVLFVSSMKHEFSEPENSKQYQYDIVSLPLIQEWRKLSAIVGSAAISFLMVLIIAIHFDMVCAPNLWLKIFKDGSYGEGIFLTFLTLVSLFMVYVSTSVNGIGGFVGKNYNVYFSSWIGFFACSYTLGLWKISGISNNVSPQSTVHLVYSLFALIIPQNQSLLSFRRSRWSTERSSNYGLAWTLFFSSVTFFALLDIFLEENPGEPIEDNQIAIMLLSSSMSVLCCFLVLLINLVCNHFSSCFRKYWYALEGILLLSLIGFWTLSVFRFTGVNGLVNGPSNAYFGSWGCFFCSISTFGKWKIEYSNNVRNSTRQ